MELPLFLNLLSRSNKFTLKSIKTWCQFAVAVTSGKQQYAVGSHINQRVNFNPINMVMCRWVDVLMQNPIVCLKNSQHATRNKRAIGSHSFQLVGWQTPNNKH